MTEAEKIIREVIAIKRRECQEAQKKYDAVRDNPEHSISELISVSGEYFRAQGAYSAAMDCYMALIDKAVI